MDQGLFHKYAVTIKKEHDKKEELLMFIEKEIGVRLLPEEVIIQKNKISFQVSSVVRILIQKKSIGEFLKQKGYILIL